MTIKRQSRKDVQTCVLTNVKFTVLCSGNNRDLRFALSSVLSTIICIVSSFSSLSFGKWKEDKRRAWSKTYLSTQPCYHPLDSRAVYLEFAQFQPLHRYIYIYIYERPRRRFLRNVVVIKRWFLGKITVTNGRCLWNEWQRGLGKRTGCPMREKRGTTRVNTFCRSYRCFERFSRTFYDIHVGSNRYSTLNVPENTR